MRLIMFLIISLATPMELATPYSRAIGRYLYRASYAIV